MLRTIITIIALTICTFSHAKREDPSVIHFDISEKKTKMKSKI